MKAIRLLTLLTYCLLPLYTLCGSTTDTLQLRKHALALTATEKARNHHNLQELNRAADYIKAEFSRLEGLVTEQVYSVNGADYRNIIFSTGPAGAPLLVIGAHYDVCGEQPGADDNASGVAGLLEVARLLQQHSLPFQIQFVAYTLEEPPYFRTAHMGSYVHAESLLQQQSNVIGMVSLEM
ncbi:MAG: M28 family peptidase, partial [Hymenobacteraceae bacterium]|nr:M28 family peptidase [Hymenobacteraceae bacterium]